MGDREFNQVISTNKILDDKVSSIVKITVGVSWKPRWRISSNPSGNTRWITGPRLGQDSCIHISQNTIPEQLRIVMTREAIPVMTSFLMQFSSWGGVRNNFVESLSIRSYQYQKYKDWGFSSRLVWRSLINV